LSVADGTRFWFDRIDGRRDPFTAASLRLALGEMREPGRWTLRD
jgi:hypothetical protein